MFEMPPYPKEPAAPRGAKLTVFLVVFIDLLGFGIVLPLLPRYAKDLLEPLDTERQLQGFIIGALLSVFSLMQFIFAPIWGRISDRVGRRPILLLGLAGSVVFYALFGFASALGDNAQLALILMFAARTGAGIAGATIATAQAVIADVTPMAKRAQGMALIGVAFGIGFTFGPLIAGFALWVLPDRPEFAGFFAALLSLIALVIGLAKMPETLTPGETSYRRGWIDFGGMRSTLATPSVGLLILVFFLVTFGFAKFEATLALLTKEFGYSDRGNFWVFAYVGFVLMLVQGGVYRRLKDRYHEVTLMRAGVGFMLAGLAIGLGGVALGPAGREVALFVALACGVIGFAFLTPSAQALISKRSDPTRQGEILGVNQSFSALARILGPLTGNVLFATSLVLPYATSAVLLVLVLGLLTKVRKD
jgi:DHA1 family tetracycline resistance protein-like MFS transporter